ncbi:MAG: hypothetical protein V7731_22970 [Amphritea sp.]
MFVGSLDDLAIETLDDIDEAFFNGDAEPQRLKNPTRPQRKRKMIKDNMGERQLKRRLNESFDFI